MHISASTVALLSVGRSHQFRAGCSICACVTPGARGARYGPACTGAAAVPARMAPCAIMRRGSEVTNLGRRIPPIVMQPVRKRDRRRHQRVDREIVERRNADGDIVPTHLLDEAMAMGRGAAFQAESVMHLEPL